VSKPLEKAGKFETITTRLEVILGSADKAQSRLKELSDFAKTTPFGLGGIVEMSNQLQTLGVYSKETMKTLTTLAAGSGKSIEQVSEAYIKMARGKKGIAVEMFRDIGISIEDFVKATGKGIDRQTGQITASSKEMLDALGQIVKDKNFEGLIEKQTQTFEGQLKTCVICNVLNILYYYIILQHIYFDITG
jgi:phage tail tape-measure protein